MRCRVVQDIRGQRQVLQSRSCHMGSPDVAKAKKKKMLTQSPRIKGRVDQTEGGNEATNEKAAFPQKAE